MTITTAKPYSRWPLNLQRSHQSAPTCSLISFVSLMIVILRKDRLSQFKSKPFMIIELDKDLKMQDLEEEFSLFYPYLKIELEPIAGLGERRNSGSVEISSTTTLRDVRRMFKDELHMFPNLFRKKNGEWIEITDDSGLTLKEENELGRSASRQIDETEYKDFMESEY